MDFRDLVGLSGAEYLRKSRTDPTLETVQQVLSKHKEDLNEFATKWKLNVIDIYHEVVSGDKIDDRPEIQKLLKNIEDLKYEFVLVMDLDRLGRGDMEDQGKILSAFKETDTFIVTPRKVYDLNDELDEEVSEMETFFARRELKLIKRRLGRGRIRSARSGRYIASTPPFGYSRNSECVLIPNKDTELLQQIFDWFVNGDELGKSMGAYKIAHRLSIMNIPTPTGKKVWQPNTILKMLTNKTYVGRIIWTPKTTKRENQLTEKRNRDNGLIDVDGQHDPIISQEIFDKAQLILKERSNPKLGMNKSLTNTFLGLGFCGNCGRHMQAKKPGGNRSVQFRCVSVNCSTISSTFKAVEERVLLGLEKRLEELIIEHERVTNGMQLQDKQENMYPKMIKQIEKELNVLGEQEDMLDTLLEQGTYDIAKYTKRSHKLREEIKLKQESLKMLIEQNEILISRECSLPKEIEAITDFLQLYRKSKDVLEKNRLLKTVIIKFHYSRTSINEDFFLDMELVPF